MLETHHQIRRLARRALVPISISALMAFALFPTVAGAQSSSEIQYRDAPPTVTGTTSDDSPASSSRDDGGSGQSPTQPGTTAGDAQGDGSKDDAAAGAAGKGGDGDGKGGAGKASDRERESAAPGSGAPVDAAPAASSDGSSPLVPILIALAVLAAISIGAVAWRRRHADDADPGAGSPVSPEAG